MHTSLPSSSTQHVVRPRRERSRPEAWLLAAVLALVLGACEKKAEEVDVGAAGGERDPARDEADVPAAPEPKPAARSEGPVLNRRIFEEANAAAQAAAVPAPVANMEISDVPADILGVRLGVTPEQAVAALGKVEPKPEINVSYAAISEEVQPRAMQAKAGAPGAYATTLVAWRRGDRVEIQFAAPPNENRVIDVKRTQNAFDRTPERALSPRVLWTSLEEKYGTPTEKDESGRGSIRAKWLYGAPDCNVDHDYWNAMHSKRLPGQCATAFTAKSVQGMDGLVLSVDTRLANPREVVSSYDRYIDHLRALRGERERKQLDNAQARPQL